MDSLSYSIGVDIGGTFTDVVALGSDGSLHTVKLPSTPSDYGEAIVTGVQTVLGMAGADAAAVSEVVHATTVATNTVLEMRGARTALVTTVGFRDVLEMRRLRIPEMYNLQYEKPAPLVPRRLRFEVDERMGPGSEIWRPLDEAQVHAVALEIARSEVEAVAICLLHAHADDRHERRVAEILRAHLPDKVYVALSSQILPEIREYERTSTTVVSAYVGPVVARYLGALRAKFVAAGIEAPLRMVKSNGGAMTAESVIGNPAHILESGPAAGVIACARAASEAGIADAISLDMGGTTAKAAMIEAGEPARTTEYEVGAGINLSSRLVKGGGYAVKLPFIDVSEIGAGGGSIVTLGTEGTIQVGPRSAGAVPGPACYDRGGTEPTFTDAMVALGYLNPEYLVGGALRIDADLSREALQTNIAGPLGMPLYEVAYGIYMLAAATMTRAVKAVTTYRGRDPRDFTLFAFGGNGPIAAAAIARELGITRILVPPAPGVFSAYGLPFTRIEREVLRTVYRPCLPEEAGRLEAVLAEMENEAREAIAADGLEPNEIAVSWQADMRYSGQAYELSIDLPDGKVDTLALVNRFGAEHERTYGHRSPSDPVDIINLKVAAIGLERQSVGHQMVSTMTIPEGEARQAYFGTDIGMVDTPVVGRAGLMSDFVEGPMIIEEYDSTCVVLPGSRVRRDELGNIEIRT